MISWLDLWKEAEAIELPKGRLSIPPLPIAAGLLLLVAGLRQGLSIQFDEKSEGPVPEAVKAFAEKFPNDVGIRYEDSPILDLLRQTDFHFATSGSTGQAKALAKSSQGLFREAEVLAKLYELGPKQSILSLVRPFHIYGFLHALLLPLLSRCDLSFSSSIWDHPPQNTRPDLLISVPAQWRLLQHLEKQLQPAILVSSGAAFGVERQKELIASGAFSRAYEILGSTETGGIGYRRLDQPGEAFRLFPGLALANHEGQTILHSPYLYPDSSILCADRLEMIDAEHFIHRGRQDRVFKYAGQRFSLEAVEENFQRLLPQANVKAYFKADEKIPQGGFLQVWIEGDYSPAELAALRPAYAAFNGPFPQQIQAIKKFPRDAQGKLSLSLFPGFRA